MTTRKIKDLHRTESGPSGGGGDGLLGMLRRDHDTIRTLFLRIQQCDSAQVGVLKEMFTVLEQELLFHLEAEERFFFTALEQHEETRSETLRCYEEHLVMRTLIATFTSLAVDDQRWPAKLKVLDYLVRHHLEQEEKVLFESARRLLNDEGLGQIERKIEVLRHDPRVAEGAYRPTSSKDTR